MRKTIEQRLAEICASNPVTEILVATGVSHYDPCHRCGGTGIYSQFHGTCYGCGGNGRRGGYRSLWSSPRLTHALLDTVEHRLPAVRHLLSQHLSYKVLDREAGKALRWLTHGGPATRSEWVGREGDAVRTRLNVLRCAAASIREAIERKEAKQRKFDERDAAEGFVAVPVTDERMALEAEVLTTRDEAGYTFRSTVTKALLKVRMPGSPGHYFKLWGTLPTAIRNVERGDLVAFTARIKVSDKDSKFGFWSRPTKAHMISVESESAHNIESHFCCPDCGAADERKGHMTCQYPQD
jgi:hypothetical protein